MGVPLWLRAWATPDLFGDNGALGAEMANGDQNVIVGQFFEVVVKTIFGGEFTGGNAEGFKVWPDVILWGVRGRDVLVESKATQRTPLICYGQLLGYRKLAKVDFPFTKPEVYYALGWYPHLTIRGRCRTVGDLVGWLSRSVECICMMHMDVIDRIGQLEGTYKFGAWKGHHPEIDRYIRWNRTASTLMKEGTRDAVLSGLKLLGVDVSGLIVRSFPAIRASIVGHSTNDFPVVIVRPKGRKPILKVGQSL